MITRLIEWSARNPVLVILGVLLLTAGGVWAVFEVRLDAIPDLSDVQAIVFTEWSGRTPTLIEDQITYPIVTSLLAAPGVKRVRGVSEYGFSYVYVIFQDHIDLYWARSRVLEYMQKLTGKLPVGVTPTLGPDATGVGWVYQYALVDESGTHDLAQLRSLQDWYLRYKLESVPGVAEVASVGGFVKQYQIEVDPNTLAAYRLPITTVIQAVRNSNAEVSGRVLEMAGTEYVIRGLGYFSSIEDIELVTVGTDGRGTPIIVRDIARVLILILPVAVLLSFIPMAYLRVTSNIMSLGGIAIAIGAMVDAAIVMVENAHKRLEQNPSADRTEIIIAAAKEVGRPLFFSLLVIAVSFLPIFALQAQEGRLFTPLAYTKTFAMLFATALSVTLAPVLMVALIRGRIRAETRNPLNWLLITLYRPLLSGVLRVRWLTILLALVILGLTVPVFMRLGAEFMPPLNEGTILYMPTTVPGLSIPEGAKILQVQDRLLKEFLEVERVFGKMGKATTATDPAFTGMAEITITLKPESH